MEFKVLNCKKLRVVYASTPEFGVPTLQALVESDHEVIAVFTQPDRPAGRGRKLRASPVKQIAQEHDIPVYQPRTLRDEQTQEVLRSLNADVMVVAAYGLILPVEVLQTPRLGCINIHASLLPRWRGAAPIHRAIEAGDTESGITIMQMAKGLDNGDMLLKLATPIDFNTTTSELQEKLAALGADGVLKALPRLCEQSLHPEVQDESLVTYAEKVDKNEAHIDWRSSASEIHRKICAFNPNPIAFTSLEGRVLRIWRSELCDEAVASAVPGEVVHAQDGEIRVATGEGCIRLLELQLPGKKPLKAKEFLNGQKVAGAVLGRGDKA